jgi:hypothetical protein
MAMKTFKQRLPIRSFLLLSVTFILTGPAMGQEPSDNTGKFENGAIPQNCRSFKMTTLTFGGAGVLFTRVNNQNTVMTGGRGSATFNNRFTIGGGGWGMTRGVELESTAEGVYNFVKMGYGGVDFGYLLIHGEKFNLGAKLLVAGGAVFKETIPESKDNSFTMFPVLEPTLYYQVSLSKLFRFEMGANYRFIRGTNLPYISDREMSGFSCYVGFLVSTIKSN